MLLTLRINCRSSCVSFPRYRFQGSALSTELVYSTTLSTFCQHYFSLFWEFFHSFVLCEYTELYICLSFVCSSICWVLFHAVPPFAFVFCWAYGLAVGGFILSQPSADCSLHKGILSAALPAKPPLKGEVPAVSGRRGSFPSVGWSRRLCQPP